MVYKEVYYAAHCGPPEFPRFPTLLTAMKQEYASRKFIDLIQGATSKWANWDPPKKIAVCKDAS
jgi:hypothetical protein